MVGSEETATRASDGFNGAATARNDRKGACSETRPSLPVGRRENMSRLTALRRRARERAMTDGEERLTGPMGCEMKPETSNAADDATSDFE